MPSCASHAHHRPTGTIRRMPCPRARRRRLWLAIATTTSAACATPNDEAVAAPIPPPDLRHGHGVARIADAWLAAGGYAHRGDAPDLGTTHAYLLADDATRWRATAPLPSGKAFFALLPTGDGAVAIGDDAQRFDPRTESWQELTPAGTLPVSHFAACAHQGAIYVLGGFPAERGALRRLDPTSGALSLAPPLPGLNPGDHFHLLASLADGLHAVGGLDGEHFEPQLEHHVLRDGRWQALPPPPVGIWTKFAAHGAIGGRLYVFGEFGGWSYGPADGWRPAAALPQLLAMPASVVADGALWVVGGMDVQAPTEEVLLRYEPADDRWLKPPQLRVEPPAAKR